MVLDGACNPLFCLVLLHFSAQKVRVSQHLLSVPSVHHRVEFTKRRCKIILILLCSQVLMTLDALVHTRMQSIRGGMPIQLLLTIHDRVSPLVTVLAYTRTGCLALKASLAPSSDQDAPILPIASLDRSFQLRGRP